MSNPSINGAGYPGYLPPSTHGPRTGGSGSPTANQILANQLQQGAGLGDDSIDTDTEVEIGVVSVVLLAGAGGTGYYFWDKSKNDSKSVDQSTSKNKPSTTRLPASKTPTPENTDQKEPASDPSTEQIKQNQVADTQNFKEKVEILKNLKAALALASDQLRIGTKQELEKYIDRLDDLKKSGNATPWMGFNDTQSLITLIQEEIKRISDQEAGNRVDEKARKQAQRKVRKELDFWKDIAEIDQNKRTVWEKISKNDPDWKTIPGKQRRALRRIIKFNRPGRLKQLRSRTVQPNQSLAPYQTKARLIFPLPRP